MTLLIKMQRTVVTFSLSLMLILINLPPQEYEKKRKIQRISF